MKLIFPMSIERGFHDYSVAKCKNSHVINVNTLEDPSWVNFVFWAPAHSGDQWMVKFDQFIILWEFDPQDG